MSFVNALLRPLFDAALHPFRDLPPIVGVTLVSLVTAVGLLVVFKHTSDQKGLEAVKRKIHAGLFEIRLFNDDFRAILRAQRDILRHNLTYLRLSAVPMLWTLPPLVLVIAQLQFHYGYRGLDVGETALLKVRLEDGAFSPDTKPSIPVEAREGLAVRTPPVWIPSLGEMAWRIEALQEGDFELRLGEGDGAVTKSVRVTGGVVRRSPFRVRGFVDELLYPAEPPLPDAAPYASIAVTYRDTSVDVLGIELHWMIVYFVLAIVFAFVLRGPFGVTL